jgi:uncharacterized membrane protein
MVKNLAVLTASLILMLVVAPAVMAASVGLDVSTGQQPPDRISSCPDTVLSDIDLMVTNLGGQTDTVMLSLDWPADLGFIKPYKTLASGETAFISPFWITLPYDLEPGVYHAKVTAKSSVTADTVTKDIEIEVLRCHSVAVIIEDNYERSCQETQEPVIYDIEIANQGKWPETFGLSASVGWAEFSKNSVTVAPGEAEVVSLVLNPPEGISAGMHTVYVNARSTESYAAATAPVEMEVVECFDFSAEIEPESQSACLGEGRDYELTISNAGEEDDEYIIEVPDWVFPSKTGVSVDAGESETIDLTVVPGEKGIQTFEVTVTSVRDPEAAPLRVSGIISVEECRGIAVIAALSELTLCKGEKAEISVSVKNTGSLEGTFLLTATVGELSKDSVTLEEGASSTVTLSADTSEMPEGALIIEVTAADGSITDTASVELKVEECYMAELTLQPVAVTVCPGAAIPYTITLKNTGKESDTYLVDFADENVSITLAPGESHTISYDYQIPYIEEGRYLFTAELSSESGVSLLESSEISLKSSEACYGVDLEDGLGTVEVAKATTVEITITNTGEQPGNFLVTKVEGPDWAYVEPSEIHLGAQEEDSVYLYLSPGFGTGTGTYTVTIKAESDTASDQIDVVVNIPTEIGEAPEGPEAPDNVSINITHPAEPGAPITGEAVEERPFWKTTAVAAIALIIVVILIMRFVLLFKK